MQIEAVHLDVIGRALGVIDEGYDDLPRHRLIGVAPGAGERSRAVSELIALGALVHHPSDPGFYRLVDARAEALLS